MFKPKSNQNQTMGNKPELIDSVKKQHQKKRSSFDIARSYVEMNFAVLLGPELTNKEIKKAAKLEKKAEKKAKKQRHRLRNAILSGVTLIIVAVATVAIWWVTALQPVDANAKATRQFTVDKGSSTEQVASALEKAGFIKNALAYRVYARLQGKVIQAGTHELSASYSVPETADKLSKAQKAEIEVQIPPGLTLKELRDVWKKYGYSDEDIDEAYNADYVSTLFDGRPDSGTLEGYIYPDTYRVYSTSKLTVVIQKTLTRFESVAAENDLKAKFAAHGLNFYQGVTLASIVNKEVSDASPDDQKKVSGIFYRRLSDGTALQSDVTFKYAFSMGLCSTNGPSCDSAYNTRMYSGLPPGPISNPSLSALDAVANPIETDQYYFIGGDGEYAGQTFYANTYEDHQANIRLYCKDLCR